MKKKFKLYIIENNQKYIAWQARLATARSCQHKNANIASWKPKRINWWHGWWIQPQCNIVSVSGDTQARLFYCQLPITYAYYHAEHILHMSYGQKPRSISLFAFIHVYTDRCHISFFDSRSCLAHNIMSDVSRYVTVFHRFWLFLHAWYPMRYIRYCTGQTNKWHWTSMFIRCGLTYQLCPSCTWSNWFVLAWHLESAWIWLNWTKRKTENHQNLKPPWKKPINRSISALAKFHTLPSFYSNYICLRCQSNYICLGSVFLKVLWLQIWSGWSDDLVWSEFYFANGCQFT